MNERNVVYTGKKFYDHVQYWKNQFSSIDTPFRMKGNKFSDSTSVCFREKSFELNENTLALLQKYANGRPLESFILLLSGFDILFSKYYGYKCVIINTPLYNHQVDEILQPYVPLIQNLTPTDTIKEVFKKVNEKVTQGYKFQNFPFSILTKDDTIKEKATPSNVLAFSDQLHVRPSSEEMGGYDLVIRVSQAEKTQALQLILQYNIQVFDDWFIRNFAAHYQNILAYYQDLGKLLNEVNLLSSHQQEKLLNGYNETSAEFPRDKTIGEIFEEQARLTPSNEAVKFRDFKLTYGQLNEKSNQLAYYLLETCQLKKGDFVGVMVGKSTEAIVAFLGILKAGGVYVPIDPHYPAERVHYIIEDAQMGTLLTESAWMFALEDFKGHLFALDIQLDVLETPHNDPPIQSTPEDLAYVIYTSGSTGKPKGVMIAHRGVVNLTFDHIREMKITAGDNVLQFFPLSFDASILDILMGIMSGATLVLVDKEIFSHVKSFVEYLEQHRVTLMTVTPSFLKSLDRCEMPTLRILITGGEEASVEDALFYAKHKTFYNAYGPSEGTVNTTLHRVDPHRTYQIIPIGKPQSNKKVYILDEQLNLLPEGLVGEICISGEGLAVGYLNAKSLTEEKFTDNPFCTGEKMYKTGDLGRWLPDGHIEFLGRKDEQIKVRGFRIELGEIESVLQNHRMIKEAVVVVKERENSQDKELIAFYKPKARNFKIVPSSGEYFIYDPFIYESMATDEMRVAGYQGAVKEIVKDKVVLDLGTGSEMILARHCVTAGAKKVYAIEISKEAYETAKANIIKYGLEGKIELIFGDISEITLPEKIDYCISALAGNIAGTDGCITIVKNFKTHLSQKEPVTFIPNRYYTKIATIGFPEEGFEYGLSGISQHYVDEIYKKLGYKFDVRLCLRYFSPDLITSTEGDFEYIHYHEDLAVDEKREVRLTIEKAGAVHGFVLWINALFNDYMVINSKLKTHHLPVFFPAFPDGLHLDVGDEIIMQVERQLSDDSLTTDYVIEGMVKMQNGNTMPFTYQSYNHAKSFRQNKFYEKLLDENGQAHRLEELSEKGLVQYLGSFLPDYMVPSQFIKVTDWPLSPNGKIDKKALVQSKEIKRKIQSNFQAPKTELERSLVSIWQEVLETKPIGIGDDFFQIGGHSLKATQTVSQIYKLLGIEISLPDLFNYPTIKELCAIIENRNGSRKGLLLKLNRIEAHKPNLFFIPPVVGSSTIFKSLAMQLEGECNAYGLQYRGFDYDEPYDQSIEQMAESFSNEIQNVQASGVYQIVGYSVGGLIAFEIAKQLEAKRHKAKLIVLDKEAGNAQVAALKNSIHPGVQTQWFMQFGEDWLQQVAKQDKERIEALFAHTCTLLTRYEHEGKIDGPIVILEASDNLHKVDMKSWGNYTRSTLIHRLIKGSHFEVLEEPNLPELVKTMKPYIITEWKKEKEEPLV